MYLFGLSWQFYFFRVYVDIIWFICGENIIQNYPKSFSDLLSFEFDKKLWKIKDIKDLDRILGRSEKWCGKY